MQKFESRPNYEIINKIGGGGFGTVYKMRDNKDKKMYALKSIELNDEFKNNIGSIESMFSTLKSIDNKNIVKYYDFFRENNALYIKMELCENKDLKTFIHNYREKNELIPETAVRAIIREICYGLKEIHSKNVIHRDLKPANIFISNDYGIKIGDFGISKILDGTSYAKTHIGTPLYMAPEQMKDENYTNKVDIWSLGCIIYEICTLKYCFNSNNIIDLSKQIVEGRHGKINLNFYNNYIQILIDLLLQKDYKKRPSIEEISNLIEKKINLDEFKNMAIPDDLGYKIQLGEKYQDKNSQGKWIDYINNMLLNWNDSSNGIIYNKILTKAGIYGFNGAGWAYTEDLKLKPEDIEQLKKIFTNDANSSDSLIIIGQKGKITNYNKGFSIDFELNGNEGGTIAKTNLAFIIGIYDKNDFCWKDSVKIKQNKDLCRTVVENLSKKLIEINF